MEKTNQKIPSNVQLIKPRNTKEFMEFAKKNKLLVINNFTKNFFSLKIFFLLKKLKIPQIRIDNFGKIKVSIIDEFGVEVPVKDYDIIKDDPLQQF